MNSDFKNSGPCSSEAQILRQKVAQLEAALREQKCSIKRKTNKKLRERTRIINLAADIGLALTRSDSLHDMLHHCAESIVKNVDAAFARIWTLADGHDVLELQASAGIYTHLDGHHSRIPVGAFKIGKIAKQRTSHLSNDVVNDPEISNREWAIREGMVAFAGHPLLVEDRLVGVIALFARHRLPRAALIALETVANQIATGIERKRTEERLKFTQFTMDHIAVAIFWCDSHGRFFNVNDAACRLVGYSREELLNLSVSDLNTRLPQEEWPAAFATLRETGAMTVEEPLRRKNGTVFPATIYPNFLSVNGQEFSCAFVQDISERKAAEESQRQSENRFHSVFKQLQLQINRMPLGYILFDAQYRVIDWNPAAEKIFGYRKEDVLGMGPPFEKIVPEPFRKQCEELQIRLRAGEMSAHSINDNLTKDGRTIVCEWINTPLVSEDGQFTGLLSLVQDITSRKNLEDQFRQVQKMEAIGKLAGGVAHDFNNLLTVILGYSQILVEALRESDPLGELVREIQNAGTRAASLTRQLLAFSRKQVLVPVVLDLNSLLDELQKMLGRLIGEDIELKFLSASDLWSVRVDANQMEQVILNLVVNARDAMPTGGTITVETANVQLDAEYVARHPDTPPGDYVLLTVTDSGCGMDQATVGRVFEPFFSTKGEKGTGLGLATVYGIVKQSGGHIEVESEPLTGTTFKVYLPREAEEANPVPSTTQSNIRPQGNETILIVEDEDGVRSLARNALQRLGYRVLTARNGGEALLMCEKHLNDIDLLLTDLVMPTMNGRELAERLLPVRPTLRVLYMSGYMDDAIVRHGLTNAKIPFLQKPYAPDDLARKVREVLDQAHW